MSALDHWLSRYDLGGLALNRVQFRPGAVQTSPFGLCLGYKIVDGAPEWGYARIHTGSDRANARSRDAVVTPLPNDWTDIIDYRGEGYGSLVRLVSNEWCYELRVAHMDPVNDIEPDVLDLLVEHKPLPLGTRIGSAGHYGIGTGRHTHTELVAWGPGREMFDDLGSRVHGQAFLVHETERDVLDEYRRLPKWRESTDPARLADYIEQRQYRGVDWSNRFRHHFTDPLVGREAWRYSSWLLMGL